MVDAFTVAVIVRIAHSILDDLATLRTSPTTTRAARPAIASVTEATTTPPEALPAEPEPAQASPRIRVFVSWAHTGEDWNSDEARDWERRVIAFTTILRSFGIDADVDLYHSSDPSVDWTRFGQLSVDRADFIVIAYSNAWGERWRGTNAPAVGAGAVVEADTIKGILQHDQSEFQRRVLVARLPGPGRAKLPNDLTRLNRFNIDVDDPDSFEGLLRTLTGQPIYVVPELGEMPVLPAVVMEGINLRKRPKVSREFSEYEAVREEIEKVAKQEEANPDPVVKSRLATLMGLLDALQQG